MCRLRCATASEAKKSQAARVEAALSSALKSAKNPARASLAQVGAVTSEGDAAHAADQARARFKVTGTGVKVCALSDGVDSLSASRRIG